MVLTETEQGVSTIYEAEGLWVGAPHSLVRDIDTISTMDITITDASGQQSTLSYGDTGFDEAASHVVAAAGTYGGRPGGADFSGISSIYALNPDTGEWGSFRPGVGHIQQFIPGAPAGSTWVTQTYDEIYGSTMDQFRLEGMLNSPPPAATQPDYQPFNTQQPQDTSGTPLPQPPFTPPGLNYTTED